MSVRKPSQPPPRNSVVPPKVNHWEENARLRQEYELLQRNEERAKAKVSDYIYNNDIEQKQLRIKIQNLKQRIQTLRSTIGDTSQSRDEIQFDENDEIKCGTIQKKTC